jgi:hypothetical protein
MSGLETLLATPGAGAAIPLVGLMVNALAQLALGRLPLPIGQVRRQFISFGFGIAATVGLLVAQAHQGRPSGMDLWGDFLLGTGTYVCLGFCLFNLINANLSSLRVRMLREYLRVSPTPLSDAHLTALYPAGLILDSRLERLGAGGQIIEVGGRYQARDGAVVKIATFFAALRRLLLRD